jgi:hypothetical protein
MSSRRIDGEIDRLYQLGPEEFTAARNELAKRAGADAAAVKRLAKPSTAAWAVNQLYWKDREAYDALIKGAKELRETHKAVLAGRRGDLRSSGKAHDAAVEGALKRVMALLQAAGQPATDATRQAVMTTLRTLPGEEPPGRLTRALQPGGFETLAGLPIGAGKTTRPPSAATAGSSEASRSAAKASGGRPAKPPAKQGSPAEKKLSAREAARVKEAAARHLQEVRAAEHTARRDEFEAARAAREAEKAAKRVDEAWEALATAQQDLAAAEAAAATAVEARQTADRRAGAAERALEIARAKADG